MSFGSISYIECLTVRRKCDSVRPLEIFDKRREFAFRSKPVDSVEIQFLTFFLLRQTVGRICEIDRAVTPESQVVWAVQPLAFEFIDKRDNFSAGLGARNAPRFMFARDQPALSVNRQAVRLFARFTEDRNTIFGMPSHDPVAWDVGEKQIASFLPHRTFDKCETVGDFFYSGSRSDKVRSLGCNRRLSLI